MARIIALHTGCGGPILDDETIYPEQAVPFLTDDDFTVTCYTCLEEIFDRADIMLTEHNPQ